jgi:putative ABC transport system permease protein
MTARTLIARSLRFHWRSHLGVVLGAAVGSAALIGALIVGDSVRESLRERALERIGWVDAAMDSGDRLLPRTYYDYPFLVQPGTNSTRKAVAVQQHAVSVLRAVGTISTPDGSARANQVYVHGIPYRSFLLTHPSPYLGLAEGGVVLNEALAQHLKAKVGDDVIVRVSKPSSLSREVVVSTQADKTSTLRLKVHSIAGADTLGNFSLRQNQIPPFNAFLPRDAMNRALGETDKANLFLVGALELQRSSKLADWCNAHPGVGRLLLGFLNTLGLARRTPIPLGGAETAQALNENLAPTLVPEAAGLTISNVAPRGFAELRSSRVFIDPPVAQAATNAPPGTQVVPVLTYLVNALRAGTNLTPYSMVAAAGPPYTPGDLRDDEIIINEWLANDLNLGPGGTIELTWFSPDSSAQLIERTNTFRVRAIVPLDEARMDEPHGDRSLLPDFPGIAKAESTHDWDAAFPLTHKIRPKDDTYWKEHRGTPKAFITLAAGQRMWANRFGSVTSIRWFAQSRQAWNSLHGEVLNRVKPSDLGLQFQPVRSQALASAEQSQDFGGLFIGFSFFLIGAALILMALLFQFGLEQRAAEIGTLLALGFPARRVRKLFLLEGAALAFIGSVIGVAGGVFYARAMLHGLTTVWRSATNTSALTFHASPLTLLIGLVSGTLVAVVTIWFVLRKQARQPARALLAGDLECGDLSPPSRSATGRRTDSATSPGVKRLRQVAALQGLLRAPVIACASLLLAATTIAWAFISGETSNPGFFFSAGSLALIAGLTGTSWLLTRMVRERSADSHVRANLPDSEPRGLGGPRSVTSSSLSTRNAARRRTRSVATVALLASGGFLIASIGAFRLDADANAWKRSSGTGGFALIGESTLPIMKDLNTREGRDALGLDEKILQGVTFVPFRVRDGDDASCLNLNRAQQPRLLGVSPGLMGERKAFSFANGESWSELRQQAGSNGAPSIARPEPPKRRRRFHPMGAAQKDRRHAAVSRRARERLRGATRRRAGQLHPARLAHHR